MSTAPGASVSPRVSVVDTSRPSLPLLIMLMPEPATEDASPVRWHRNLCSREFDEADRPASERVDQLRRAVDDGVLPEAQQPGPRHV